MKKNVNLVWLWNDAMNRNGSQGNVLALSRRLEWRGISCHIRPVPVGTPLNLSDCDILYIGAGQPYENQVLLDELSQNAGIIQDYVNSGRVLLAVCEGFELMGKTITLSDQRKITGAAVAPFSTVYGEKRMTGNMLFSFQNTQVACFENHAGLIHLEEGAEALGTLTVGIGNTGKDKGVGLRHRNLFGCSAYNLLPNNPALCDAILLALFRRDDPKAELGTLNDSFEVLAHDTLCAKLKQEEKK